MSTPSVNPEMLMLARDAAGKTQSELAKELGVQQATVSKMEAGLLGVTNEMVEMLAARLNVTKELFYQSDRIYGFNSTVFFHRKRATLPERILRRLHAFLNVTRMRIGRLIRGVEAQPEIHFPQLDLGEYQDDPEEIARLVRGIWMVPEGPIRNITECIEAAGGIVIRVPFGSAKIDAISEWVPGYPPIFLVNADSSISGERLRLTIAHELGHMVMHRLPNPEMEEQANKFAAELLMPRRSIKGSLYRLTFAKLLLLKGVWKVSMAALIRRARDLGTITEAQYKYWFINLGRKGYKLVEPDEIPPERAVRLLALVAYFRQHLNYGVEELRRLLFYSTSSDGEFVTMFLGGHGLRLL